MAILLNPRFLIAIALAILLSTTHLFAYRSGKANVRADFDSFKIKVEQNARIAEELARQESDRRQHAFDDEAKHAREEKAALEVDVARLADTADGLRGDLAAFKARAKQNPAPAIGSKSEPGSDPIDLLAILYARADREAATLAEHADRLRQAGQACERAADKIANP